MNHNNTLSLSIMSGKGGVGKTNIVLNLGYALHFAKMTALLMDCDLGLANLDVLLGISPDRNLNDLLQTGVNAEDILVSIEDGFDMLPATSGVPELVEMDEDLQDILFKKLVTLAGEYDFLMLDLGAGISHTVLSFAALSQLRIVVVTPEPTSLTDSYAMIKILVTQHDVKDFLVLVNQATSAKEANQTFDRLSAACRNFLNIELRNLGFIHQDSTLVESVRRQTPLMKYAPEATASKDIIGVARKIMRYRNDNLERIGDRPILKNFPSE
ncbi:MULTISPECIES: MinD/ParA family protein [unclassified Pseudodesulfovibrio]|uniref:MinD/ParA family protein n=1 Tax=unclassified Pseudodesulfovibrio TaxID=2661612 RepID=UPI000FEB939D|nr:MULTISPECIES: MinD/ParA family protein [unclassified Pseudodesulfovibrio]MCJ2163906.1 MinD/ParA family protein [Pseudodesulfovibrio sp. S3-i]RWU05849.1 MinD/ParA family protein [Pseudodesulfovibrio sp. S3]